MEMGPILSLPYSSSPLIVVSSDYDVIKRILNSSDEWIDRPKNELLALRANGDQDRGILTSSGPVWRETRKYTKKTMTLLGLGKKSNLEYTTNEELKHLLLDTQKMIQKTSNCVSIRGLFSRATINVIWRIVGGTRFSLEDPEFIEIVHATDSITETSLSNLLFADMLGKDNVLRAPALIGVGKQYRAQETMKQHFTNILQKRQEALREKTKTIEDENFTDHFLEKINSVSNDRDVKIDPIFNLDNLIVTLFDLFEAGVETTSSTLEFAIMYLATHPEVQRKMLTEIETVIGDREPLFYTDSKNMPYTQAVISEVHRMASMVPLNFRRATRDCYINDTFIKKGTGACINQYSIHYDEKFWKDPYNFRPERFLTNEGQLDNSKLNRLLHFGSGRRLCVGDVVAKISLFTFLVGMLQKYEFQQADPNEEFGMDINSTFSSRIKPFHVHFAPL
jgi:cytochrome P450